MLQLYRLTNTDIFALKQESKELDQEVRKLKSILSSNTVFY